MPSPAIPRNSEPAARPSGQTCEEFVQALLEFIEKRLAPATPENRGHSLTPTTPLFEGGLINSLAILRLIGFVEARTGRPIPHRMVVMKHFRTVEAIADSFWQGGGCHEA